MTLKASDISHTTSAQKPKQFTCGSNGPHAIQSPSPVSNHDLKKKKKNKITINEKQF